MKSGIVGVWRQLLLRVLISFRSVRWLPVEKLLVGVVSRHRDGIELILLLKMKGSEVHLILVPMASIILTRHRA